MRNEIEIESVGKVLAEEFAKMEAVSRAARMISDRSTIAADAERSTATCWLLVEALRWVKGDDDTAFGAYVENLVIMHHRSQNRKVVQR